MEQPNRLWKKNFIERPLLSILLVLCSSLLTVDFIGLLLPFAYYSRNIKIVIFIAVFSISFFLLHKVWKTQILPGWKEIKKHWFVLLIIAVVITGLILSLTQSYTPLYPVEHTITIRTEDPMNLLWLNIKESNWERSIQDFSELTFAGEWYQQNGKLLHPGNSKGEIVIKNQMFISDPSYYSFYFEKQDQPTDVEIVINDVSYQIKIPANDGKKDNYNYRVLIPQKESSSKLYRIWIWTLPVIRWGSLLIIVFTASLFIRIHSADNKTLVFRFLSLFLLVYLLYVSLNLKNEFINTYENDYVLLIVATIILIFIPLGIIRLIRRYLNLEKWILLVIFLLAIGLRVYWLEMVPTAQVSDFGDFHRWALQLASGKPNVEIKSHANFTRLLSSLYRIYPSDRVAVGMNIFFSLISMVGLVSICRQCEQRLSGVIAAYLFAILPSQIGMTGIVCTDILSTALLIICVSFLIRYIHDHRWFWLMASGFSLASGIMIRSVLIMYVLLFILPLCFQFMKSFKNIAIYSVMVLAGLVTGILIVEAVILPAQVDNMALSDDSVLIWNLLNGTNIAKEGKNNFDDTGMVFQWTKTEAYQKGIPLILERIFSDPVTYYQFLKVKYSHFFADDSYAADLAFLGSDMNYQTFQTKWNYPTEDIRSGFARFSQYAYWCILVMALFFVFRYRPKMNTVGWICLSVLLINMVCFAFLEVQPRYHIPVVPFLILFAALAMASERRSGLMKQTTNSEG